MSLFKFEGRFATPEQSKLTFKVSRYNRSNNKSVRVILPMFYKCVALYDATEKSFGSKVYEIYF